MILTIVVSPLLFENSFAQQMSVHQQWKKFTDVDMLTCKSGNLLIQKSNGNPACVMPSTYLKLIDRGYGVYDQSLMNKNPEMMNNLMNSMASNEKLMSHWHEMMQNDSTMMMETLNDWVLQMKNNPELLKNMLSPMTSDPELRKKMIDAMKNHPQMETHLKLDSAWMDSIHQPMMDSGMGQEMHQSGCIWCSHYEHNSMKSHGMMMSGSSKMMDMIHHVWINSEMTKDIHTLMLEDPSHMAMMSNQMMEPILNAVMNDEDLREEMIELMLQHKDFMNSIRHESPETAH
ncbi:hypothetical protein [Nitrosopumilus oxyclinae]|uniref:hypothetical protein n=1 Tax=Nitrosopumilus oxyclinae TaxID=1959104 RepID=UPI001FE3BDF9|nr:hypothetical protein [Nitrosopumilus oxyclinae]